MVTIIVLILLFEIDIKAFQLPNVGLLKRSGNFYMEVKLGGLLKLRTVPVKGPTASWMESFTL